MFSKQTYIERRNKLKKQIKSGILLFLGNEEVGMNYEANTYDFRQDSTFLYFFGLSYASLYAIIDIDNDTEIIFGNDPTIDDIVWTGNQPSLEEKSEWVGVKKTLSSKDLGKYLERAKSRAQKIHYLPGYRPEHKIKIEELLGILPVKQTPSLEFIQAVVEQRSYKTDEELKEIEKACEVTAEMHLSVIKNLKIGMKEYEISALLTKTAMEHGCRLSFPNIATINGQILHNYDFGNIIQEGGVFLIDAGAETGMGYAGDMSSTLPAGKKFTLRQKEIYDIQVAAHTAAVDALKPGVRFESVYDLACKTIFEGMKSLGIAQGDSEEAVRLGAHAMFFPCGLGHMMGLDVHDMENLGEIWVGYDGKPKSKQFGRKSLRLAKELKKGFVLTIEPGIYFIPELIDLWKKENKFKDFLNYEKLEQYKDFGGLRNEEDYLITETGHKRLGKKIPLTTEEVEALR